MNITELDNTPAPVSLKALLERVKEADLPEDLSEEQLIRLTLWLWNGNHDASDDQGIWEEFLKENEAYFGEYSTVGDFAEHYFTEIEGPEISSSLVVDWEATNRYSLQFDFHEYAIRCDLDGDGFAEHHRYFWRSY